MKRSKEILVVCHCLLNSNSKVYPLAEVEGVYRHAIKASIDRGVGILQLPCPETCYLGMKRWGMTKEQYDHPAYRSFCQSILQPSILQIKAFIDAGYTLTGIAGMDGSPNCGIEKTCLGFKGGEVCNDQIISDPCKHLRSVPGMGVFMEVLKQLLIEVNISIPLLSLHNEPEI